MTDDALARTLRFQAAICARFGSSFSAGFLEAAAADLEAGGPAVEMLRPFEGLTGEALFQNAATLRFLAAFHDLALSGEEPALSAAYPGDGRPGNPARAWNAARAAAPRRMAALHAFMRHEPQTNETRRSACLLGGFLEIAAATGLPLRCLELGASAGLNQSWDRFHYDLGSAGVWGPEESPVRIDTDWSGPPPRLAADVRVASRAACDRAPIDVRIPENRRRLLSYIWADQTERLALCRAAIEVALANEVRVEAADAAAWTAAKAAPTPGFATVVYHSIFWQYLPPETLAALVAAIEAHGAAATTEAPLAWLKMEPSFQDMTRIELRLTLWPGGEERLLADVHAHGATVAWRGTIATV